MEIELQLPYPPTVNHYWLTTRTGKKIVTEKGKYFRYQVLLVVNEYKKAHNIPIEDFLLNGDLYFDYLMLPPDKRKRDIDNVLKATFDALSEAKCFKDDEQIVELHGKKQRRTKTPSLEPTCFTVKISEI